VTYRIVRGAVGDGDGTDISGGSPSSFQLCDGPVEWTCACAGVVVTGWLGSGAFTWIDRSEYKESNG